jgi:uncharacterized delta-60 repeat protein
MSTCQRITLSAITTLVASLAIFTSVAAATTSVPGTQPSRGRVFGAIPGPHGTALVLQPGKAGVTVARYLRDGRLDHSFGRGGIAFDPRSNFYLEGHLAAGPEGTIVASSSESVTRFTEDGRIDRSYADRGEIARLVTGDDIGLATNVVLENGAMIVAGPNFDPDRDQGVIATRYGPGGRIDRRYGMDGRAFAPLWNDYYEPVTALAMQGRRLLVLSPGEEAGQFFLTRLTAAGKVDRSFGEDGLVGAYGVRGMPVGMIRQSDGSIVVATSGNQFLRFGPDATRDMSFGPRGKVTGPAPSTTLHSLVEAPGGDLIAAGSAADTSGESPLRPSALVVERLRPTGEIDTNFGTDGGYVITSLGPELNAGFRDAMVLPGGRLFLAGQVADPKGGTFGAKIVLAGLEPEGSPASDFGKEGVVITDTVSTIGGRRGSGR